jgi:hypothetical protein
VCSSSTLARQVLVQPLHARPAPGPGVGAPALGLHDARTWPGGRLVVQETQHRRVGDRGAQQGLERAGNVRAYRFALEGTGQRAHAALAHRDREVVGPEQRQALGKRSLGGGRGDHARADVLDDDAAQGVGRGRRHRRRLRHRRRRRPRGTFGLRQLRFALLTGEPHDPFMRTRQPLAAVRVGRADLRLQPAARVAGQCGQIRLAQAEAMGGDPGLDGRLAHETSAARRRAGLDRRPPRQTRIVGRPGWTGLRRPGARRRGRREKAAQPCPGRC